MSPSAVRFVRSRQARWEELGGLLDRLQRHRGSPGLAEVDRAYALSRAAAADLAQAQRDFRGTELERQLAQLVSRATRVLEAPPLRQPWRQLWRFLGQTWPQRVFAGRRLVLAAAAVLAAGVVLGALACWVDPEVGAALSGPAVAAAVENGELWTDPLEARGQHAAAAAFIFSNNIRVAIGAFAAGLLFGVGSLLLLLYNGLNLGATLALTGQVPALQRGLLDFIAAHGPVELSLIAIAGGAGLRLGSALIDPGQRPRIEVLRTRGREAVQLVLGTVPLFVGIGLVEGFVSPGQLLPTAFKLLLGALLWLALLAWVWQRGRV